MQAYWYTIAVAIINNAARAEGEVTGFAYIEHGMPHGTYDEFNAAMDAWADAQTDLVLV